MTFEKAVEYALSHPDTERTRYYGMPAVQVKKNRFLSAGHEPQKAFALHMDLTLKKRILESHPESFFETEHYSGYPVILVRYDSPDDNLVREMIRLAIDHARTL